MEKKTLQDFLNEISIEWEFDNYKDYVRGVIDSNFDEDIADAIHKIISEASNRFSHYMAAKAFEEAKVQSANKALLEINRLDTDTGKVDIIKNHLPVSYDIEKMNETVSVDKDSILNIPSPYKQ